jgi:hypothetical protein
VSGLEHPTWDTLAKVSTVAEQMRRRAEAAEIETRRLASAQNEYWATIERLEAQHQAAVETIRALCRVADGVLTDAEGREVLGAAHAEYGKAKS